MEMLPDAAAPLLVLDNAPGVLPVRSTPAAPNTVIDRAYAPLVSSALNAPALLMLPLAARTKMRPELCPMPSPPVAIFPDPTIEGAALLPVANEEIKTSPPDVFAAAGFVT